MYLIVYLYWKEGKTLKSLTVYALSLLTVIAAAGCSSANSTPEIAYRLEPQMVKRGKMLDKAMNSQPVRGTVLGSKGLEFYAAHAPVLIQRLKTLGINRIYVEISPEELFDNGLALLTGLAEAAKADNIGCEALLMQKDYVQCNTGRVWKRKFGSREPLLDAMRKLRKLYDAMSPEERFSGVTVVSQIHLFTLAGSVLPSNAIYLWSDEAYGPGRDNDLLLRQNISLLKECRRTAGNIPFAVAIPSFYHERAVKKELTCGKVTDFLAIADKVLIMGEGSKPTEFANSFNNEFKAAAKYSKRVIMGVNLAAHTAGSKDAIRKRDWQDFVNIVGFLTRHGENYPAFGGMVFIPWNSLESLYEE